VQAADVVFVEEADDFFRYAEDATVQVNNRLFLFFGETNRFLRRSGGLGTDGEDDGAIGITHVVLHTFQQLLGEGFFEFVADVQRPLRSWQARRTPTAVRRFVFDGPIERRAFRPCLGAGDDDKFKWHTKFSRKQNGACSKQEFTPGAGGA